MTAAAMLLRGCLPNVWPSVDVVQLRAWQSVEMIQRWDTTVAAEVIVDQLSGLA